MGKTYRQGLLRMPAPSLGQMKIKPSVKPKPGRSHKASWSNLQDQLYHGTEQYHNSTMIEGSS